MQRILSRFELLTEVTAELFATSAPLLLIQPLCEKVMRVLGCNLFLNYMVCELETPRVLRLNACSGVPADTLKGLERVKFGNGVCGTAAEAAMPFILSDVRIEGAPGVDFFASAGIQAYACYPIVDRSLVRGTISFGARDRAAFTPDALAVMKAVADQIAIALHRVEQEQSLRASEERRSLALLAAQDGIWDWNPLTKDYVWSDRLSRMLGYEPHEIEPSVKTFNSLLHPDDVSDAWDAVDRYLRRETEAFQAEFRLRHKDGSYRSILSRGMALFDAQGAPLRMVGAHTDVTKLHEAQKAKEAAVERLQRLVDVFSEIMWVADADGRAAEDSPSWRRFTGRRFDQGVGDRWLDSIHPDDRHRLAAGWDQSVKSGRPFKIEFRQLHNSGEYRHMICQAAPIHNSDGSVREWVGMNVDITERKRVEEQLRESEERLRLGLAAGRIGTWDWDISSGKIVWSEQLYEFHGLKAGEFEGTVQHFFRLIHPEDRHVVMRAVQASLEDGRPYDVSFRVVRPTGDVRWHSTNGKVYFRDGEPVRMLGATIDVTERTQAETALARSEARFRAAQELSLHGFTVLHAVRDSSGSVVDFVWDYVNPAAAELLKQSPAALVGKRLLEILPGNRSGLFQSYVRVVETGEPHDMEVFYRSEGIEGWFRNMAVKLDDGVAVSFTDITPHKQAEEQMGSAKRLAEDAKAFAESANEAKDQFLAVLSHELRTPLTPVLTAAQMLERDDGLNDEQAELLRIIRRNVELETKLIDDLLDLTRISRGKLPLFFSTIDLHEKIEHVRGICESEVRSKAQRLIVELKAGLHFVRADGARLQQILWNVLKNAVKFTPIGGSISIRTFNDVEGEVKLEVQDTGCGIEPEALQSIFNAFEQGGRDVTRRFGGLGLGLTISKSLVEMHGGSISVRSEGTGSGSTFTVTLPLSAEAQSDQRPGRATRVTNGAQGAGERRILVVEDNADTLRLICRLLESDGCSVRTADSVSGALKAIEADTFDLLISDIGLPDGSGLDLMRQACAIRNLRGIALSGYGMEEDHRRSKEAGFAEHLTKPVNLHQLESAIRRLLHEPLP